MSAPLAPEPDPRVAVRPEQITPEDVARAEAAWRKYAPPRYRLLLDAAVREPPPTP